MSPNPNPDCLDCLGWTRDPGPDIANPVPQKIWRMRLFANEMLIAFAGRIEAHVTREAVVEARLQYGQHCVAPPTAIPASVPLLRHL